MGTAASAERLEEIYKARVDASLSVSLTILQPTASKPTGLEDTKTHTENSKN
jgi:hypothetical protein